MKKAPEVRQVSPAYRHYKKKIHSHGVIEPTNSRLKWYDISRGQNPIDQVMRNRARDFLSRQTAVVGVPSAQELGFVLLHRCGQASYFLGLCTWRENNELWKKVFYFDAEKTEDFVLFPQGGEHRDTFCVWELAIVSHETLAWTTYLSSDRTIEDANNYMAAVI